MNILFLTSHFNSGGITSYVLSLSKHLIASGHCVYVVSSGGNMVEEFTRLGGEHIVLNVRTKCIASPKLIFAIPRIRKIVDQKKINIMHAHTHTTQFLASVISQLSGISYVSTCHGFFKMKWFRKTFPYWGKRVIAISDQVAEHLEKDFKIDVAGIDVIRNGIDLDLFRCVDEKQRDDKRRKLGYVDHKIVGIIARLSDVKAHDVLIDAIDMLRPQIPNMKLVIVGEGKEEHKLKQQVKRLDLMNYVAFYPVVDRTAEFLVAFDCFVMPSRQEGLGLSVMEAQAIGLPVVASRVGGLPSLIEDGVTGLLVTPNNVKELSCAIARVLNDEALAKSLGFNAYQKAANEYGAADMARDIIKVYEKVTGL